MLARLAPAVAECGRSVRVDVLTERVDESLVAQLSAAGVEVQTHGFRRLLDPRAFAALHRHFRTRPVRVIHTQLEAADAVGTLLARRLGVAAVSTQHVFDHDEGLRAAARNRLQHLILRRLSSQTIAVSAAGRQHLVDVRGHRPDDVIVIPNGISLPPTPSDADRRMARERLDLSPTAKVVICCAVLRPPKGIQRAIEALGRIEDAHLLVIGDGPHRGELEKLAVRTGVDDRVHFVGHRTDVMDILPAADVFVHPTLRDVLPTVIVEAMASKLPVVASDTGGVPELVVDGVTGTLVTPDRVDPIVAAIRSYLDEPARAETHGAAGRSRAESTFAIEAQAARLVEIYDAATRSMGAS